MKCKTTRFKIVIVIIELIILILLMFVVFKWKSSELDDNLSMCDWKSNYISYDNGWYIDSDLLEKKQEVDMIYGPYVSCPKGYYTVKIWYSCDNNQSFMPFASKGNKEYVKAGTGILDKSSHYVSYKFKVTENIDNLEIVIKYNGKGYLRVNDIKIETNSTNYKQGIIFLILVFLLLDILLFGYSWMYENKKLIWTLIGIVFLTSLPIFTAGINNGHDLRFHLMRIEGIAKELRLLNFPVRISSNWLSGYGYPVSIYYGDILLYLPAFLRIMGFTVITSYKVYIVFINFLTASFAYICFKRIFKNENIALMSSFIYCTSSYRMTNLYVRAAAGEYSAMTFFPIIALAIYYIYYEDIENKKRYIIRNSLILSFGMSGVIQTHVLSTEMVIFLLIFICLLYVRKTIRLKTILTYIASIAECLLMNLWFIIPFVDYYLNVPVRINDIVDEKVPKIQYGGVYLAQYFSFLQTPFGKNRFAIDERMLLSPGLLLMMGLIVAIIFWINKKANKVIKNLVAMSGLVLFVASDMFPWNSFAARSKLGVLMSQVQFPWRYVGLATILLSLLTGFVLIQVTQESMGIKTKSCCICIAAIGFITTCEFVSMYSNGANIVNYYDIAELDSCNSVMNGEYLRVGSDYELINGDIIGENVITDVLYRQGTDMKIKCKTDDFDGTVTLPLFNYKGYRALDDFGSEIEIKDNINNQISFVVPKKYEGIISISFAEPWYWRISEMMSLFSLILVVIYLCTNKKL